MATARDGGRWLSAGYTDLVVDVLIRPSGAIEVLNEEDLPASRESRYRLAIAKALETYVTEAKRLMTEIERETRAVLSRVGRRGPQRLGPSVVALSCG